LEELFRTGPVAREYGLPCVIGISNATTVLKTGDTVLLDGKKGVVKLMERPDEEKTNIDE